MISVHRFRSLCLLAAAAFAVLSAGCNRHDSGYRDHVVVRVNQAELTAEQFSDQLMTRLKSFNLLTAKDSSVVSQAKAAIVQNFIVHEVTEDWAKSKQIFVRKEQLDNEIRSIRSNYPDDIAFRKSLADNGLGFEEWQDQIKFTLLERLVLDELRKQVKPPSADQIKSYYQANKNLFVVPAAVKLRQVVLENEVNAQKIMKSLQQGKSLASLAQKFSISSEASLGGDVGWIERGYLAAFDNAFRMNVGQRSSIYKSQFGYHIFEVTAKRTAKTLSLEEAKQKIEKSLVAEQEQIIYSTWLEEQVLKARVFKDDDFIKHIQVHTRGAQ